MDSYPSPPWTTRTKTVVAAGLGLFAIVVLVAIRPVIGMLVGAGLVAFLLSLPIGWMEDRLGWKRWVAILIAYLGGALIIIGIPLIFVPALITSIAEIDWVGLIEAVNDWLVEFLTSIRIFDFFGISIDLSGAVDPVIDNLTSGGGSGTVSVEIGDFLPILSGTLGFATGLISGLFSVGFAFFTILFFSIYMTVFGRNLHDSVVGLAPQGYESDVDIVLSRVGVVWNFFLAGQIRVMFFTGIMTWIALWLVGTPGAFLLGVTMGVLNVIPTLGPILATIPGVFIALVQGSTRFDMNHVWFAVIVLLIYIGVQQIESQIVVPRVMSDAVDLSPLAVLTGVIVGFNVFGLLGALIAVPVIASAREVLSYLYSKLLDRRPFTRKLEGPKPSAGLRERSRRAMERARRPFGNDEDTDLAADTSD